MLRTVFIIERKVTRGRGTMDDEGRTQRRIAALIRAAQEDGTEMTAPARAAFRESFLTGHKCKVCKPITISPKLPPEQRARAAAALISAHYRNLAKRSKRVRAREKADREAERELEQLAQFDAG
jgi:hypothetical protein